MGWWQTESGDVLGDGPLNVLEAFESACDWKSHADIPASAIEAITKEYRESFQRDPTDSELESLLALEQGDSAHSVLAKLIHPSRHDL